MQDTDADARGGVPHDSAGADVPHHVGGNLLWWVCELADTEAAVQPWAECRLAYGSVEGSEGCGAEVYLALLGHVHLEYQEHCRHF